ncbi:MAG TPA: hypothetical protein DCZ94_17520 [Lentisphaeria bacterium]|nr:MAG: hypothetical protein A2X48_13290 [Lentisphaerae bacterium GWF2_49_21]HBC88744.1 hypothetical protein [Lentisphaeria bacterium]
MREYLFILAIFPFIFTSSMYSQEQKTDNRHPDKTAIAVEKDGKAVFRAPFILKLKLDKGRTYEQKIEKTPYVADNNVYIFPGESFGINISIQKDEISRIDYQKEMAKADIEFTFKQELDEKGDVMMMLAIVNKLKKTVYLDATMTVPDKKEPEAVTILPLEAGLSGNEMWPHPILQLVLNGFRLKEKPAGQEKPKDNLKKEPAKPVEQKTIPKRVGKLKIGNILYEDRNNDGRVDYESMEDNPGGADGFVYYKIDDDFDGFYDRSVKEGGIAGEHTEKKIHVEVSPIKGLKYPNP